MSNGAKTKSGGNPKTPEPVRVSFLPEPAVPASGKALRGWRLTVFLLVGEVVILGGASLIWWIPVWRIASAKALLQAPVDDLKAKTAALEQETGDLAQIAGPLAFGKKVLDQHKAWEKLFVVLERTTLPSVVLKNLALDSKGVAVVPATAKDWNTLIGQIAIWRSAPEISAVGISGASLRVDEKGAVAGVDITATLSFKPEALAWKTQ